MSNGRVCGGVARLDNVGYPSVDPWPVCVGYLATQRFELVERVVYSGRPASALVVVAVLGRSHVRDELLDSLGVLVR